MDFLEFKVYRNENELVGAFIRETDAKFFCDNMKTIFEDYKVVKNGKTIYSTAAD